MDTFVTYPEEGGPFPSVLILMDIWGLREESFQRMVDWDGTLRQLGMVWSRAVRVDAPPEPTTS